MSGAILDRTALIECSYGVEPLPASATRLAAIVAREDWEIEDVEEVVRLDPTLTARLLRAANSAAAAANTRITTVHDAVVRLGPGAVVALSVAGRVGKDLRKSVPEYGLASEDLWTHSVTTAFAAEMARAVVSAPVPPESFTAALLHDFGKLILARFLDTNTLQYLKAAQQQGQLGEAEAEWEILELHHGEVGGLVAQHWELPDSIIAGITHHHTPSLIEDPVADVVHLANCVAHAVHDANGDDGVAAAEAALDEGTRERMKLREGGFATLTERVRERFAELKQRYG